MKRKAFIKSAVGGVMGLSVSPLYSAPSVLDNSEPLKVSLVKEFVSAGHSDLEKVKEMLDDYPNLIYSRYDWGNGDFEEAIEGAGHLGNKEIAEYLIEKGARVNLFVLTMLGKTALVKPILENYPILLEAKGAHGFTMLHHAKVGGKDASVLYEYLQEKGLKETKLSIK
ncbi:MAG: ankyrin repeat domain-containing protein [Bacteroidota bacterium]